jgi:hypothetical protein
VSLILEALRKLEREKQAPERGVVVVGAAAWPRARGEHRLGLFLLGLALGGTALGAAFLRQRATAPAPPVTLAALPAPAATPVPPPLQQPSARPAAPVRIAVAPRPEATPSPAAAAAPVFTLQAISERDGRAVAIVNERMLFEGDSIDGARIVRIAKDEVELDHAGRRLLLRF